MTWQADERALREFGLMMVVPQVRAQLRDNDLLGCPTFLVDESDSALDVLTAATMKGLDAIILARVAHNEFTVLKQVVVGDLDEIAVSDQMTVGQYVEAMRAGATSGKFTRLENLSVPA